MQVPQSAKLYGLAKVHKPNIPMRPIVSFFGSPTYQLSKQLTNILNPLTDKSQHKLQSKDNFIDAIKTVQIPDDHKLVTFGFGYRQSRKKGVLTRQDIRRRYMYAREVKKNNRQICGHVKYIST